MDWTTGLTVIGSVLTTLITIGIPALMAYKTEYLTIRTNKKQSFEDKVFEGSTKFVEGLQNRIELLDQNKKTLLEQLDSERLKSTEMQLKYVDLLSNKDNKIVELTLHLSHCEDQTRKILAMLVYVKNTYTKIAKADILEENEKRSLDDFVSLIEGFYTINFVKPEPSTQTRILDGLIEALRENKSNE